LAPSPRSEPACLSPCAVRHMAAQWQLYKRFVETWYDLLSRRAKAIPCELHAKTST
jgi:hypothetical protein